MPKFAANLTMLFNEVPFLERFGAAASSGFEAVEFLFPYDFEKAEITRLIEKHNLRIVLHNLPAGDWARGDRGIACHPDRIEEFRRGVPLAVGYATALGCPKINCLA